MAKDRPDCPDARADPARRFETPMQVARDPHLDRRVKRAILEHWERDARELAVAEEEGMGGTRPNLLGEVRRALRELGDDDDAALDQAGTATKHGGGPPRSRTEARDWPARAVMAVDPAVVHVDDTLTEARARLRDAPVPVLVVLDGDEVVGVLTARAVASGPRGTDAVRDRLMTEIAFCRDGDALARAGDVMEREGTDFLLVLDSRDRLAGILSRSALASVPRHSAGPGDEPAQAGRRVSVSAGRATGGAPGRPRGYSIAPALRAPTRADRDAGSPSD